MRSISILVKAWPFIVLLALPACYQNLPEPRHSGFLGDDAFYQNMAFNSQSGMMEYLPQPESLSQYRYFIVPPVMMFLEEGEPSRDERRMADELRRRFAWPAVADRVVRGLLDVMPDGRGGGNQ